MVGCVTEGDGVCGIAGRDPRKAGTLFFKALDAARSRRASSESTESLILVVP